MPRPRLKRRIGFDPIAKYFKPQGVPMRFLEVVELSAEEMEAFRLRYVDDMDQHDAAGEMNTSQSTYNRILISGSKKIARALSSGLAIKINDF